MAQTLDIQAGIKRSFETKPFPAQESFYSDTERHVLAIAAVRSGKSLGGAAKVAARIVQDLAASAGYDWQPTSGRPKVGTDKPRATYWVVGPSYDLGKIAWAELRSVLSPLKELIIHETDGVIWLRTGILIQRKTGADEAQLQGASLSGCWIDEVCTLPYASYLQIKNRLADKQGWLIMSGSPRPDSWVKSQIWDDEESPISKHLWTTEENPWFPREELEIAKRDMPEAWYKRDFLASWDTFVGLIYNLTDDVHVIDPTQIPTDMEYWAGQDWGSASPGALIVFGRDKKTNDLYVVREDYTDQLVIAAQGNADSWVQRALSAHSKYRLKAIYCDVSGGDQGVYQYRKAGLPAVSANKGPGSIIDGIRVVTRLLHPSPEPRLRISSECTNLIKEMHSYSWAINKAGEPQDRVDPLAKDHACDALRYGLVGAFGKELELLPPKKHAPQNIADWSRDDLKRYGQRQAQLNARVQRNRF